MPLSRNRVDVVTLSLRPLIFEVEGFLSAEEHCTLTVSEAEMKKNVKYERIHDIYLASPNAHASRPVGLNVRSTA